MQESNVPYFAKEAFKVNGEQVRITSSFTATVEIHVPWTPNDAPSGEEQKDYVKQRAEPIVAYLVSQGFLTPIPPTQSEVGGVGVIINFKHPSEL
jgi:hypothetical protein